MFLREKLRGLPLGGLVASVVLFMALAYFFRGNRVPVVSDEIGYLTIAKYLVTGETITLSVMPAYRFGQALLYMPFFAAGFTDEQVYQIGVLINCAQTAAIPLLLILTARSLEIEQSWALPVASFLVTVFPASTYQLTVLWPETSIRFAVVALTFCVATGWRERAELWWLVSSAIVVWIVSLHGRGLIAPIAFGCLLWWGTSRGRLSKLSGLLIGLVTIGGIVGVSWVNSQIEARLWGDTAGGAFFIVANLTRPGGLWDILVTLCGHLWALVVGSYGLIVVGVIVAWQISFQERLSRFSTVAFCGLLLAGSIALSALHLGGMMRVDHLIYSRYNDPFTTFFNWIGLWAVLSRAEALTRHGLVLVIVTAGLAAVAFLGAPTGLSGMVTPNIPSLLWTGLLVPIQTAPVTHLIALGSLLGLSVGLFLCLRPGVWALVALAVVLVPTQVFIKRQTWGAHNARGHVVKLNEPAYKAVARPLYWDRSVAHDLNIMFDQYIAVREALPLSDLRTTPIGSGASSIVSMDFESPGYRCAFRLQYAAKIVTRDNNPNAC